MAAKVETVYSSGRSIGVDEGMVLGRQEGYSYGKAEGIEQGKQAEYDAFWDAYQQNGNRADYTLAFAENTSVWILGGSYKPKYPLRPKNAHQMYYGSRMQWAAHEAYPVDFSECTDFYLFFAYSAIDRLGVIDMSKATRTVNAFQGCNSLHTIDKLISSQDTAFHNSTFTTTQKLANITFEGVIGQSISLANSPLLTNASVQSIIDHLKDLTGATAQTLTLHADVKANLTDGQLATITGKNWSVA
jgi:hypothetical protein